MKRDIINFGGEIPRQSDLLLGDSYAQSAVDTDLSIAYATQNGYYTKKGDEVTAHIDITTSTFTHTTAAGALTVSLPFAINANNNPVGAVLFQGWTSANSIPLLLGNNGAATASPRAMTSGGNFASLGAAHFTTGSTVRVQGMLVYKV